MKKIIAVCLAMVSVVALAGCCIVHSFVEGERTEAGCITEGTITYRCSICRKEENEIIPAIGHNFVEDHVKEETCTEAGERVEKCTICGEMKTEIIEPHHNYEETVVLKPKCEKEGKAELVCSYCGDSQEKVVPATGHTWGEETITTEPKCEKEGKARLTCTECGKKENKTIEATGHSWIDATCIDAKTCSTCKKTEGEALGHTTDMGKCSRCNGPVMKQSPVTVIGMKYTIDYVGGVEWQFKIRNNSSKEIKYITFQWSCYNAVGDLVYDEISGKSYVRLKFTGPLAPGKTTGWKHNTTPFYCYSFANIKWNEITVEYMDGTTETITEYHEGYYQK